MTVRVHRSGVGIVLAAILLPAFPDAASAITRNVAPGGSTSDPSCTAKPCELEHAVEDVAQPGDEVFVQPGTHTLGGDPSVEQLRVDIPIDLHGAAEGPRPVIRTSRATAILIDHPEANVSDLDFDHFDRTAVTIRLLAGVVERVYAKAENATIVCEPMGRPGPALIRDSVCWNVGGSFGAGDINAGPTSPSAHGLLINVTAVGYFSGVLARADSGSETTIDAHNVIASSSNYPGGLGVDAQATTAGGPGPGPGDRATLNLSNSNYAGALADGAGATVTPPGSGSNQTTEPILADPANGNFHQSDGSPTIDAGASDPLLGFMDFDREGRIQGPAPDIGADEGGVPPFPLPPVSPVDFEVSAPVRERVRRLFVELMCESGPCAFVARGKVVTKGDAGGSSRRAARASEAFRLRRATATVATGETRKLRVKIDAKDARRVEDLMRQGHEAKARIKVAGTDPAGNRAVDRVRIKIDD